MQQKRVEKSKNLKPTKPTTDEVGDLQPTVLGKATDEELMRRTQNGDKNAL